MKMFDNYKGKNRIPLINKFCDKHGQQYPAHCKHYENEERYSNGDDYYIEWCNHPNAKCDRSGYLLNCPIGVYK